MGSYEWYTMQLVSEPWAGVLMGSPLLLSCSSFPNLFKKKRKLLLLLLLLLRSSLFTGRVVVAFTFSQPVQIAFRIHFGGTHITLLGLQLICLFCYYSPPPSTWLASSQCLPIVTQSIVSAPSNHWKGTRNLEGLRLIHPFIDGTRQ